MKNLFNIKRPLMRLASGLRRFIYWPLCRAYARSFLRGKPADRPFELLCSLQFRATYKYWPNFRNPHRFSEKIWNRMLFDRDPRLTLISDKLLVRGYISEKIGQRYLVPLLWHGNSPEEIPYERLPNRFVIKANHGCGYVILVPDKSRIDEPRIRKQVTMWLKQNFAKDKYLGIAWGYDKIVPKIIIESYVGDSDKVPIDYKFYCFAGRVEFATLHFDRFGEHRTRTYDRNFQPHEFRYDFNQWAGEFVRPSNYGDMVGLAETLAADFDFMRVDLYSVRDSIYFSELTPYPGGVDTKFLPPRQEYILGERWPSQRKPEPAKI